MIGSLLLSLKLAAVTTAMLFLIAVPLAWLLAYGRFRGRTVMEVVIALPLVLPPTVLGYYVLVLIAPEGLLGRAWSALFDGTLAFSFAGMVVASVLYSLPFAVQPMQQAFRSVPATWLELGRLQGLRGWSLMRCIVLPASRNGMVVAAGLAFAHTMGEFGAVLMVGGSIPGETKVASIALFELVEMQKDDAALLALILLGISLAILSLVYRHNAVLVASR